MSVNDLVCRILLWKPSLAASNGTLYATQRVPIRGVVVTFCKMTIRLQAQRQSADEHVVFDADGNR
jgi:hypothetical protein